MSNDFETPELDQQYSKYEKSYNDRVNFRNYLFLREDDFTREQMYHLGHRYKANQTLHGYGIVQASYAYPEKKPLMPSMPVSQSAMGGESTPQFFSLFQGFAIDSLGREIIVAEDVANQDIAEVEGYGNLTNKNSFYLSISYDDHVCHDNPKKEENDKRSLHPAGHNVKEVIREHYTLHATPNNPVSGESPNKLMIVLGYFNGKDFSEYNDSGELIRTYIKSNQLIQDESGDVSVRRDGEYVADLLDENTSVIVNSTDENELSIGEKTWKLYDNVHILGQNIQMGGNTLIFKKYGDSTSVFFESANIELSGDVVFLFDSETPEDVLTVYVRQIKNVSDGNVNFIMAGGVQLVYEKMDGTINCFSEGSSKFPALPARRENWYTTNLTGLPLLYKNAGYPHSIVTYDADGAELQEVDMEIKTPENGKEATISTRRSVRFIINTDDKEYPYDQSEDFEYNDSFTIQDRVPTQGSDPKVLFELKNGKATLPATNESDITEDHDIVTLEYFEKHAGEYTEGIKICNKGQKIGDLLDEKTNVIINSTPEYQGAQIWNLYKNTHILGQDFHLSGQLTFRKCSADVDAIYFETASIDILAGASLNYDPGEFGGGLTIYVRRLINPDPEVEDPTRRIFDFPIDSGLKLVYEIAKGKFSFVPAETGSSSDRSCRANWYTSNLTGLPLGGTPGALISYDDQGKELQELDIEALSQDGGKELALRTRRSLRFIINSDDREYPYDPDPNFSYDDSFLVQSRIPVQGVDPEILLNLKGGNATLPKTEKSNIANDTTGKHIVTKEYVHDNFDYTGLPLGSSNKGTPHAVVTYDATGEELQEVDMEIKSYETPYSNDPKEKFVQIQSRRSMKFVINTDDEEYPDSGIKDFSYHDSFSVEERIPASGQSPNVLLKLEGGKAELPKTSINQITENKDIVTLEYLKKYYVPNSEGVYSSTKPTSFSISNLPTEVSGDGSWNGIYKQISEYVYKMDGFEKYVSALPGRSTWIMSDNPNSTWFTDAVCYCVDTWPGHQTFTWHYYTKSATPEQKTFTVDIKALTFPSEPYSAPPESTGTSLTDSGAHNLVRSNNGYFAKDKLRMDWNTTSNRAELEVMTSAENNGVAIMAAGSEKLTVDTNGIVSAPAANNTNIANNNKALITKEYADANYKNPPAVSSGSKVAYGFGANSWSWGGSFAPNGGSERDGGCSHLIFETGTITKLSYFFEGHDADGAIKIYKNESSDPIYTSPVVSATITADKDYGLFTGLNVSVTEGDRIVVRVVGGGQAGQVTVFVEA